MRQLRFVKTRILTVVDSIGPIGLVVDVHNEEGIGDGDGHGDNLRNGTRDEYVDRKPAGDIGGGRCGRYCWPYITELLTGGRNFLTGYFGSKRYRGAQGSGSFKDDENSHAMWKCPKRKRKMRTNRRHGGFQWRTEENASSKRGRLPQGLAAGPAARAKGPAWLDFGVGKTVGQCLENRPKWQPSCCCQ